MPGLLPLLTLSYLAGILLADGGRVEAASARALACACVLGFLLLRRAPRLRVACCAALALAAGTLALAARLETAERERIPHPVEVVVEAHVCDVRRFARGIDVDLCRAFAVGDGSAKVPSRIRLAEWMDADKREALAARVPGDRIRARLRLRPPGGLRNPGARERDRALARRGIGARASLTDPHLLVRVDRGEGPRARLLTAARRRVRDAREQAGGRLARLGPGGGLLRALALGDRGGLPAESRTRFARLGIAHLLAVSGLHVALVVGLVWAILTALLVRRPRLARGRDPRKAALAAAFGFGVLYGVATGWGIPVRRALLFALVSGAGLALGRRVAPLQLLALAALPILLLDPAALFDLGAQLSFVASGGLLLALQRGFGGGVGEGSGVRGALARILDTSAIAIALTAPLIALHGGASGPAGLLTNLVAIPWTGFVLLPIALVSLVLVHLPAWPACRVLLGLAGAVAESTLETIDFAAGWLPGDAGGAAPALPWLIAAAALGILTLRARPGWQRVALALASSSALLLAPPRPLEPSPPRLVVLDVGQGDAILVQGRSGTLLVDAGRALGRDLDLGRSAVLPALKALGVERLDLVVASHADLDHRGGLGAVLAGLPVGALWLPAGGGIDPGFAELVELAEALGVPVVERAAGDADEQLGDLHIELLWPPRAGRTASRNEGSLVLKVRAGEGGSVLLTGDIGVEAEHALLASGRPVASDILKVGHHGSRGSSSPRFLEAVGAELAIVSAPCHGRAGLPSLEALSRIARTGAEVAWTGRDGAIIVALSPRSGFGQADAQGLRARGWGAPRICGGPEWRGLGFDRVAAGACRRGCSIDSRELPIPEAMSVRRPLAIQESGPCYERP